MTDNQNVQTSVQEVDLDIDSWLGAPGADSIITPESKDKETEKPNFFSPAKTDLSFLDEPAKSEEEKVVSQETTAVLSDLDKDLLDEGDDLVKKPGRPKTEKSRVAYNRKIKHRQRDEH